MPTIAQNNDLITVILIFSVEPEQQQELVNNIVEFIRNNRKVSAWFCFS